MPNFYDEWREQLRRENMAAAKAEYFRCVAAGEFEDCKTAWDAFGHGWYGVRKFDAAKKLNHAAGSGWYSLGFLCGLMGFLGLAMMALSIATFPEGKLIHERLYWFSAMFLVLLSAAGLLFRRYAKVSKVADAKHRAVWGDPASVE